MKLLIPFLIASCAFYTIGEDKAYVNFDELLSKTNAGRNIEKKLKKEFESLRSSIQKREKQLQKKQEKLQSEASLLSESEKRRRLQKIQQEALEYQQVVEQKKRELDEYRNKLILEVKDRVTPIVAKIAKDKELKIVYRMTDQVLWVKPQMNITASVVRAYRKKYK